MRGRDWASKLMSAVNNPAIKNVAIVGAGYIGTEASEVFAKAGKHVTLMDMIDRPLGTYLNPELLDVLEPTFKKNMDLKGVLKSKASTVMKKLKASKLIKAMCQLI